ncbi:unnamed protein product [Somion occarium]|uniref:Secreted protein n=1 Tax=Somion occarium TaxID=3059160 RepID=A0ABP1CRQ4_9APHY
MIVSLNWWFLRGPLLRSISIYFLGIFGNPLTSCRYKSTNIASPSSRHAADDEDHWAFGLKDTIAMRSEIGYESSKRLTSSSRTFFLRLASEKPTGVPYIIAAAAHPGQTRTVIPVFNQLLPSVDLPTTTRR